MVKTSILKKIAEGAEADIYETIFFGIRGIVKHRRERAYIPKELDMWLRLHRTKIEARIISAASMNGVNVAKILFVDSDSIYLERIKGRKLSDIHNNIPKETLRQVGMELAGLHNMDIVHGDYTKANIMITEEGIPMVIDFGLSEQTNSIEEKALDLMLLKRSLEDKFPIALNSYMDRSKDSKIILSRLGNIEKRGRYQDRSVNMVEDG